MIMIYQSPPSTLPVIVLTFIQKSLKQYLDFLMTANEEELVCYI